MRWQYREALSTLRHYALFIGYPRSGHTLVAAILDAHPRMLFANGLDAAYYAESGFSRDEVVLLSIWNSLRFTRHGRRSNGYAYVVPQGDHGRWERLEVVGDKSGDLLSYRLLRRPGLIDRILGQLGSGVRFIHVIRNPFDCIATMARRNGMGLQDATRDFFALCDANRKARSAIPAQAWRDVHFERLFSGMHGALGELCEYLGVTPDERYVERCRRLVFSAPRESRRLVCWPAWLIGEVTARMRDFPRFDGYRF